MAYTMTQIIELAEALLDEPGTGNISTTYQVALLNAANLDTFHELVRANPSFFMVKASITWPSGTESLDISGASYLNATIHKLYSIESIGASTVTPSNLPQKLSPMSWMERTSFLSGGSAATPYSDPAWYTLQGVSTLYVAPVPTQATVLNVYYIPALAKLTSGDGATEVLAGKCDEFQVAVAYRYADLVAARQRGKNTAPKQLWLEQLTRIAESATDRNEDEPRYVHYVD